MSETYASTAGSYEHSDTALAERTPVGWGFWLWWVLASAVGFTVAAAADNAVSEALDFVVYGVPVGVTQWLVLRRQVSRAGWWILATIAGFVGGQSLRLVLDDVVSDSVAVGELLGMAVALAVFGAITGGALVWLLRHPAPRGGEVTEA